MSKRILLVGGGGHCKSVLDSLLIKAEFSEIGIIDVKEKVGSKILGIPVIGCDDDLSNLFADSYEYAFVSIGSVGNPIIRIKLFNKLNQIGFIIPNIIDSSAVISSQAEMEEGIFVGKNAVINAGAIIHKGAIINTGAIVEHDCIVNDFAHISPGSVLSGEVQIGRNTHIGANCAIKQCVRIGSDSIIGMGSVVLKDIGNDTIAFGNPCRKIQ